MTFNIIIVYLFVFYLTALSVVQFYVESQDDNKHKEFCQSNHNLYFIISNWVGPFYLSTLFSGTI
jgi:hypothetical protein